MIQNCVTNSKEQDFRENLIVAQLAKKFLAKISLLCSQYSAIGPIFEPAEYSLHSRTLFRLDIFKYYSPIYISPHPSLYLSQKWSLS